MSIIKEFKEFAMKGNIVDLAVGTKPINGVQVTLKEPELAMSKK